MGDLVHEVSLLLKEAEKARIGSAYAAGFGRIGGNHHRVFQGRHSLDHSSLVTSHLTFFELASVSKIISTTSIFMVLHEAGQIDLSAPLEVLLPEECVVHPHLKKITLSDLLSHTSGLPAWLPLYEELKNKFGSNLPFVSIQQRKEYFYQKVLEVVPEAAINEKVIYSDIGFWILGYYLEKIYPGKTIGELAHELVWSKISSAHALTLHYRPVHCDAASVLASGAGAHFAATEICPWRGWLQGQVHDDNSWSMGGVSAHTGVFGTLDDVLAWMNALVSGKIVSEKTLRLFFKEINLSNGAGSRRALGFDLTSLDGSGTTGFAFGPSTVGHLGFSGTSIWIDLDTGEYACLLTNRVHPSRTDLRIRDLRINFHTLVRSIP